MIAALKDVPAEQWVALAVVIGGLLLKIMRQKVENTKLGSGLQGVADAVEASSRDIDSLKADAIKELKETIAEALRGTPAEKVVHAAAKQAEAKVLP